MKPYRPEHCLALASTGWGRAPHQVEALLAVTHAHALAKGGQTRHALADIQLAETTLTAGTGDEAPFWALVWGPPAATVHSRTAMVFETLGDRPNAAQYATAAASRPGAAYARIIALDLAAQAEQQVQQGSIEQACTTWGRAIDNAPASSSTTTVSPADGGNRKTNSGADRLDYRAGPLGTSTPDRKRCARRRSTHSCARLCTPPPTPPQRGRARRKVTFERVALSLRSRSSPPSADCPPGLAQAAR
ncbi:hypothetical protein [Streptomyces sp. 196(2019)]|uniref:hypothetical protein n=1 Tax=Streptomyces sp. 196(2019) TaxID=2683820 RepID=UPI0019D1A4E2|nr:hypothetical protein [Streptomyces sp. 196(2019)]